MGMDVMGNAPEGQPGHYFRASVWTWRPLCRIMDEAGYNVPASWDYNDGAGLSTVDHCEELAQMLEQWIEINPDFVSRHYNPSEDCSGLVEADDPNTAMYTINRSAVKAWIDFLKNCDGEFHIW